MLSLALRSRISVIQRKTFGGVVATYSSDVTKYPSYNTNNPNLKRSSDERDITQMDLLEERIRQRGQVREFQIGGQTQKWNYRSEIVNKHGLDDNHRNIWMAYAAIIIFGFGSFVYVKSNVVMGRKEEMEQREKMRRELNLQGVDRKKIGVVDL